jgi:hypothetical protein
MRCWFSLVLAPLIVLFAGAAQVASAAPQLPPAHTQTQAEVNVLRVVPRSWKPSRMPGLVNSRTHLLVDNTEAVCHGQGKQLPGRRYSRFVCVVRPKHHLRRQGLYVTYRALANGRFKISWLAYRRT